VNLFGCRNINNKLICVGIDASNFVRVALGFMDWIDDENLFCVTKNYYCASTGVASDSNG